ARTLAILPVAAVEQHGPHLPLDVDARLLQGVIDAALPLLPEELPLLLLPPQNIGLSTEHLAFAGTLSLSPETLLALWRELGEAVARTGIRTLMLLNSHGGNVAPMDIVARTLRQRCDLQVWRCSWSDLPLPDEVQALFSPEEHRFGIHGGAIETSMMLHLAPASVRMEHARHWRSSSQDRAERCTIAGNGKSAKLGWAIEDYNASGAVGDATAASAEKGARLVAAAGEALARLIIELQQLPAPDGQA
ncbi:MAG: creatininase family protein, partial [Comamonas sp.]